MPTLQELVRDNPPASVGQELAAIREHRDGRPLVTLYTSQRTYLHVAMVEPFYEQLETTGTTQGLDLFLQTTGGMAEVPASLVSLIKDYAEHLAVLLPYRAMSGGTHIALAAEELVMGPVSALGSVDPKRTHHLLPNPQEPHSVQDLKHCIDFVNDQWQTEGNRWRQAKVADIRAESIGDVVRELFNHVHPLAVGALEQSYELARMVTGKVLRTRSDFSENDPRIKAITEQLAGKYFSHAFLIHRNDVETDLGLPVKRPDPPLWNAIRNLHRTYADSSSGPFEPIDGTKLDYVAFMDTEDRRCVLARLEAADQPPREEWVYI